MLFNIINRPAKITIADDDEDQIIMDEAALQFVRDVFSKTRDQHNVSIERVKEFKGDSLNFSVLSKYSQIAFKSYTNLLKVLLKHELEGSQIPFYYWNSKFSLIATKILSLHAEFLSMEEPLTSFARWTAFTSIHCQYPINLKTFHDLLDVMVEVYRETEEVYVPTPLRGVRKSLACLGIGPSPNRMAVSNRCGDELRIKDLKVIHSFWDSSQQLTQSFTKIIRGIHHEEPSLLEVEKVEVLKSIFEIEKRIEKIISMECIDKPRFVELVKKALTEGTAEHLSRNVKKKVLLKMKNHRRLDELIRLMSFAKVHLCEVSRKYAKVFDS